jgi:hypothetical protein
VYEVLNGLVQGQQLEGLGGEVVIWRRFAPISVCVVLVIIFLAKYKLLTLNHDNSSIEFLGEQARECHICQIGSVPGCSNFTRREENNLPTKLESSFMEHMTKQTGDPGPFQYWELYQNFCWKVPLLGLSWSRI